MTSSLRTVIWGVAVCLSLACLTTARHQPKASFEFVPGFGYYLISNSMNWTQALKYCNYEEADLTVINSEAEAEVLKQMLIKRGLTEAFVGVTDRVEQGQYVTVKGVPLSQTGYSQWADGAPGWEPTQRCVAFNKDGFMVTVDCSARGFFSCEIPSWRYDYTLVAGLGHYKLHPDGAAWSTAWTTCRAEGADLAVINSDAEYRALQLLVQTDSSASWFHVGLHARYGDGYFLTVHGTPVAKSGYNRWNEGYPRAEDVFAVFQRNASLESTSDNLALPFICEHALLEIH